MAIGRYYEKRDNYLAALNRYKRVVIRYQTTTHVPEALERMVEVYVALGLMNDAKRTAAVLGYNYPGSPWYQYAYRLITTGTPGTPTYDADAAIDWIPGIGGSSQATSTSVALPAPKPAAGATKSGGSGWFDWLW
jgi:outer membrane protein assembly factor BamD